MHDRVGAELLAQPGIEGEIAVRRHQSGIVIAGWPDRCCSRAPAAPPTATLPKRRAGKDEAPQSSSPGTKCGSALGRAPARGDRVLHRRRQDCEEGADNRSAGPDFALQARRAPGQGVGRPGQQRRHQRLAVGGNFVDAITGACKRAAAHRRCRPACRGRRHCRCGRRDWDNWPAPARRAARPPACAAARAQPAARSATKSIRSGTGRVGDDVALRWPRRAAPML